MSVTYVPGGGGGGGGGDASAANQVIGNNTLASINAKSGYNSVDFYPGYSGSDLSNQLPSIDPEGSLVTRGAVLTDEGTFRINFANTSLAVSIGTVTIVGDVVTGTGFITNTATDVHYSDYFKLDADGETAWVQIDSIDSDTQLTLRTAYVGGTSGAASRALVRPSTGTGGTITVGSGQCTLASGTTANQNTFLVRNVDYAPLVFRSAFSISQRIINQTVFAGMSEPFTVLDRWYARFSFSGTVNTVLTCVTGRNPTTTPSGAEIQTTTVTLPLGLTTASSNDYRIELLTERVLFYVNGIRVAEHTRVIPSQHDEMECAVRILNAATPPATSTNVVVDYMTGKNHNKLEIGVMSDSETIVASAVPLQQYTYGPTAGVIAINTDLMVLDCSQIRSLYIQCNSMGTTGVVTVQWSNTPDFAQPITATLLSEAGATSTTFNAAVLRVTNAMARYCRLRLTTATTAGTTTLNVWGAQTTYTPIVTTQPVSGTVTATVTSTRITPNAADGHSSTYHLISAASTNDTLVLTGARSIGLIAACNTNAAARYLKVYNKATAPTSADTPVMTILLKPGETTFVDANSPIRCPLGLGIRLTTGIAVADTGAVAAAEHAVSIMYT